jgi:hypothetical protein
MAKYSITHTCGHEQTIQIVGPEKDRASKADWYRSQPCTTCKRANKLSEDAAATAHMAALIGSPKQVTWATKIRAEANAEINRFVGAKELRPEFRTALDTLFAHNEASFWIDHRNNDVTGWLRLAAQS